MKIKDQGDLLNRYTVIPRTLIFIFNEEGKVLLIKGHKNKKIWSGKWNGLGGHIEQGEDVYSSARRELFEESGLISTELFLCGIVSINTQDSPGIVLFIFKSSFRYGSISSSDEGELAWFFIDELIHIPCVEDLTILLPRVQSINIGDQVFYAISNLDQSGEYKISFV